MFFRLLRIPLERGLKQNVIGISRRIHNCIDFEIYLGLDKFAVTRGFFYITTTNPTHQNQQKIMYGVVYFKEKNTFNIFTY